MSLGVGTVAVLMLAANMRTSVNVVAVVMPEMRDALGMSGALVGLLAALPTFCFATVGATGPSLARRLGLSRTALLCAIALTVGQLVRSILPGIGWVFAGSVIAMAGLAMTNVIMPSLVRQYFPGRVAAMTTAYTAVMAIVASSVAFVTIPVERAFGADYRLGLGMWAVLSAVTIIPWLPALRTRAEPVREGENRLRLSELARSGKAWAVVLVFGLQSWQAYIIFGLYPVILTDGGMDQGRAGAQIGVVALSSAASGLFIPLLLNRLRRPASLTWVLTTIYVCGYAGLLLFPQRFAELWSVLIGLGGGYFTFALFIVNVRSRTHAGVLALSAFMQSLAYLIAGIGVTTIGVIHGDSRNWTWVIVVMIGMCVVQQWAALICVQPWYIEDHLPRSTGSDEGTQNSPDADGNRDSGMLPPAVPPVP